MWFQKSRVRVPSVAHSIRGSLNFLQALILGIVQGASEFFPVSSSAHLKLARLFLDLSEGPEWVGFDLACHGGTWLALAFFLRRSIWETLRNRRKIAEFALALFPLVPAYFLLKPLRVTLSSPSYTGYFLLTTAAMLLLACRKKKSCATTGPTVDCPPPPSQKWIDVLFIGSMQALALIPGISRSGSTIAAARLRGWSWISAARFSFLLAIPTILGGEILESLKSPDQQIPLFFCAVGFAASFVVGSLTVQFVFSIYERQTVKPLAWYCMAVGLLMIAVFRG